MKRFTALLLCGVLAMTPAHGINLPDLGDVAASELSPRAERRIGESIMQQIRFEDHAYLDDIEVEEYINRIGSRLASASTRSGEDFHFFVIDDPSINAFALPGGYIGIHTGLLLTAETESELASVLGHEIAHVTQRHIAQLFGRRGHSNMVMLASIFAAVLAGRTNPQMGEAAIAAGAAGSIQSQLNYSRAFEREADRIGLQIMDQAGFDPEGMPSFFSRLQRSNRAMESSAPGYLRTHPLTAERFTDMQSRVAQMRYRQVLDSPDFGFVRAKLRAQQDTAVNAVSNFETRVEGGNPDVADRYGLAQAYLRANRLDDAEQALETLREHSEPSPFVEMLAAEIALAQRQPARAADTLEAAVSQFPDYHALRYRQADALLAADRIDDSARLARRGVERDRSDERMWERLARAEEGRGNMTAFHRAQAEVYALRSRFGAAIHQLELARTADDGDFYDMSAVDARMREFKAEHEAREQERR